MKARCLAVLAALGCGLGVPGCFSPGDQQVAAGPEERALARTLLNALGAVNARVVDDALADPASTATSLTLHPAKLSLAPLSTGTLVVSVVGLPKDARVAATLLSWAGGDAYLEVPRVSTSADPDARIEVDYAVAAGVCMRLCDRVHRADLLVSVALSDGRVAGRAPFSVELDCVDDGNPALCDLLSTSPAFTVGAALDAYRATYCECLQLDCADDDTGFASQCLLDLMAAHPDATGGLARCMVERLETASACLDTGCDTFGCLASNQLFNVTASCGLVPGPLDDELLACFVAARSNADAVQCDPSFSIDPTSFCNGSQDCVGGFDELACPLPRPCDQSFSLQPASICNGFPECGSGFDEQGCEGTLPGNPGNPGLPIPFD